MTKYDFLEAMWMFWAMIEPIKTWPNLHYEFGTKLA